MSPVMVEEVLQKQGKMKELGLSEPQSIGRWAGIGAQATRDLWMGLSDMAPWGLVGERLTRLGWIDRQQN